VRAGSISTLRIIPATAAAALLAVTVMAASAGSVAAQVPGVPGVAGVEVWGGAGVGSFAPTGAGLEMQQPGPVWGVAASWGPWQALGAYVAFASVGFGCSGGFCQGLDVSFASRGLSMGVRGEAPVAASPWLRVGALLHNLEQQWTGSDGVRHRETTDAGAGLEAALGVSWRITERLSVTPGVHVGFLSTRAPDGVTDNVHFRALQVGLRLQL
jgi:hypothetical protein